MRGEHNDLETKIGKLAGSPPHARGTQVMKMIEPTIARITPACAGNTCREPSQGIRGWDHPRMRGEHFSRSFNCSSVIGSPPHARGTLREDQKVFRNTGITPACAGNTVKVVDIISGHWDHPRMRGEHSVDYTKFIPDLRITPACAGNTYKIQRYMCNHQDHPRMRGEHKVGRIMPVPILGSPPHARGTRRSASGVMVGDRITPACAGNTRRCSLIPSLSTDHPRMRGEHAKSPSASSAPAGSPPHARGTRQHIASRQS